MKDIKEIRKEINGIDEELVRLFRRRLEIVEEVAQSKRERRAPVLDPAREREILYRVAGEPDVKGKTCPFTDVPIGSWFFNAVIWAADAGVTTGMGNGTFAPGSPITREQMATMIIRYALTAEEDGSSLMAELAQRDPDGAVALQMLTSGIDPKLAEDFPAVAGFKGFPDAASISPYARWNVLFCRLTGIMKGDEAGTFRPQATLSRAECAQTFLNVSNLADSVIAR